MSSPRLNPPSGAQAQVARLLTLVPYLHAHGGADGQVRVDEAARVLGVSPEQLVGDLKVLLMCGLPGGYPDDLIDVDLDALEGPEADGVIRVSNADYLARPLRLTPTEATAIIVALRALRSGAGEETQEVVDRALAKLEAAAAEGSAAPQIDPGEEPPRRADTSALERDLAAAVTGRRQVRMTYFAPSRDEVSERTVDPRGIVTAHGFRYLDAWCHRAAAPRLFRIDRIQSADVLDQPIQTEPAPPRDTADGLFTRAGAVVPVTLHLDREARWIVEYYPMEAVRPGDDGALEVDLLVADQRWLQRLLLRLAPHVRVVTPGEVEETLLARAGATLDLYR